MFSLADKNDVGKYLSQKIDKYFKNQRQFAKECICVRDDIPNPDDTQIHNEQNRLSQILKGTKDIQLYDLPVFTRLLRTSCEELLSAGKCHVPTVNHLTNYSIAFSHNPKEWDDYINREDKIILNCDEYGKTVINYALEFNNYEFVKYLLDKKYIWFVGPEQSIYCMNFGAGTCIGAPHNKDWGAYSDIIANCYDNFNVLVPKLNDPKLRSKMITLAIQHNDTDMLTQLHAREIPSMYQTSYQACYPVQNENYQNYFDYEMLSAIANASDEILTYFCEEFEFVGRFRYTYKFMFPYINILLELLIKSKHKKINDFLKFSIAHNKYVYNELTDLIASSIKQQTDYLYNDFAKSGKYMPSDVKKSISRTTLICIEQELETVRKGNFITFRVNGTNDGIATNIVSVNAKSSSDVETQKMIDELNELCDKIHNIQPII